MIKYYQIKEAEELAELKDKTAKYKNFQFSFSNDYIAELKEILFAKKGCQFFAKDEDGKFAGYISGAETIHPGYFTIYELFVDPEFQGRGIASDLLEKIFEYAKRENLKGVITQTEFENIPAQKLYEKIGFIKINNPEWTDGITYELRFFKDKK